MRYVFIYIFLFCYSFFVYFSPSPPPLLWSFHRSFLIVERFTQLCQPTSYVEEHKQKRKEQAELEERERELTDKIDELRENLRTEREKHEKLLQEKKNLTVSLKEELRADTQSTGVHAAYLRAETEAKLESQRRMYTQVEDQAREKIQYLEKKKTMESRVHRTTIDFLKRKQVELQRKGEMWEQKLLDDVAAKDAELEAARERRDETKARLFELQERYEREKEEERERQTKRDRIVQLKKMKEQHLVLRKKAVAKIWNWWTDIRATKLVKGKDKKKSKKAKKGKKGKKK